MADAQKEGRVSAPVVKTSSASDVGSTPRFGQKLAKEDMEAVEPHVEPVDGEDGEVDKADMEIGAALAEMRGQIAQLTNIVAAQQQYMATAAPAPEEAQYNPIVEESQGRGFQWQFSGVRNDGLRPTDAMTPPMPGLELHAVMTPQGWHVELSPGLSMAHINQLRVAARQEIQQMATRMKQMQHERMLSHRATGKLPGGSLHPSVGG